MANEEGTIQLMYNGEIYNFQDLRFALAQKGHRFRSRCNSEVVVRVYEEWGKECVDRFNGMFASALYDGRNDQLFLARDRSGEKPQVVSGNLRTSRWEKAECPSEFCI